MKTLILILTLISPALFADEEDLPPVDLLSLEDASAQGDGGSLNGRPLLIAFVADYCHYCEIVIEDYLKPMLRNREYDSKVVIRTLDFGMDTNIIGFDGEAVSISEFANQYQVKVTPTVVFVDKNGSSLAPTLVGVTNSEFYGGFLDQAIDEALNLASKLAANRPATILP